MSLLENKESKMLIKMILFQILLCVSLFSTTAFEKEIYTFKNRVLKTAIWYPTFETKKEVFASNAVFKGFEASSNSAIKDEKFPLIIFAHGTSGNWRNLSWLANDLSKNNIVMAANHPGYTSRDSNPKSVLRVWKQAKDVSFLITQALNSKFKNNIDKDKIYVLGFSLGGYTALALSCAKLDMSTYKDFCAKFNDKACEYFKEATSIINKEYLKESSQDLRDKRIKKIIAFAPGLMQSLTNESLKNISIPTLIIGAQYDHNVPVETVIKTKFTSFSKTMIYKELKDATHFSFMQECTKNALPILKEENAEFACIDGKDRKRVDIHEEIKILVKDFLK